MVCSFCEDEVNEFIEDDCDKDSCKNECDFFCFWEKVEDEEGEGEEKEECSSIEVVDILS